MAVAISKATQYPTHYEFQVCRQWDAAKEECNHDSDDNGQVHQVYTFGLDTDPAQAVAEIARLENVAPPATETLAHEGTVL